MGLLSAPHLEIVARVMHFGKLSALLRNYNYKAGTINLEQLFLQSNAYMLYYMYIIYIYEIKTVELGPFI